jgi:hypothetical protein
MLVGSFGDWREEWRGEDGSRTETIISQGFAWIHDL